MGHGLESKCKWEGFNLLRVGLTGGLACGKSTVAAMMAARGARVIEADAIAHDLMRPGKEVYSQVIKHFGREIVNPNGEINRAKLAEAAFGAGKVAELNRIVHPAVIEQQQRWMAQLATREPHAIAVVEAALILEAGVNGRFDMMIMVTCSQQQKVDRFAGRVNGATGFNLDSAKREAEKRIAAQLADDEKIKIADFVIDNSESLENTERQVESVMSELRSLAASK